MTEPALATADAARIPADADARRQALDPAGSFIVQAPAGSGKTELLIRRTLVLLAHVDAPEEIVALTFTRKAAAEMRSRVLQALARAADDTPPADAHARDTWRLARAARAHDAACGWGLTTSPHRLRIQTIDGLCSSLVRRLPVLSRLGGPMALLDDAEPLYRAAARATLALLEDGTPAQSAAVATVLLHLDNDGGAVETLLVKLLARRDQWIRHAARHDASADRAQLEEALAVVRREAYAIARDALAPVAEALLAVARSAAQNLPADSNSAIAACADLTDLPPDDDQEVTAWRGLTELLLTAKGEWRKTATAALGFPAPSGERDTVRKQRFKDAKDNFAALIEACSRIDGLMESLAALTTLPPPRYDDAQWEVLGAVMAVLRLAAAQLDLVFAARGQADFTAVAQGALRALGSADAPSDLLLALDARIRHLLIDEFQDTSVTQFELLERLTAGWSNGDGRTLLLVGDPMQSIYLFREAEVGLFLRARHDGVGGLRLQPLQLSTNFRSAAGVVDWVNAAFARALPTVEDITRGAVPYESATHWHPPGVGAAVTVHAAVDGNAADEARRVAAVVAQARQDTPAATVAVLVRSRAHLAAVVPALQAGGVPLRAVEIESLAERPVVLDLMALTRALLHPADRIAWLALLRAPWCGLTLADLDALVDGDADRTVWSQLCDARCTERLSDDGRARVRVVVEALAPAIEHTGRGTLRDTVTGAWLRLGGADVLRDTRDADDADAFFELLATMAPPGTAPTAAELMLQLSRLYAAPTATDSAAAAPVELMTIHKAKGLEFDVVIVPGLERRPRATAKALLAWTERPRRHGGTDLVLGVAPARGDDDDAVHAWLTQLERERRRLEGGRLLYVAATRARHRLHLFGIATRKPGSAAELRPPAADALLRPLWPVVAAEFEAVARAQPVIASMASTAPTSSPFAATWDTRTWRLPPLPARSAADLSLPALVWQPEPATTDAQVMPEFSWAGERVRLVGTLVHRWLQRIADDLDAWDAPRIESERMSLARALGALGLPATETSGAVERAVAALTHAIADPRGRWILTARPLDARAASELRLTGLDGAQRVDVAIDRTFVEHGVRWVIDHKTGTHEGADVEAFLDREVERYRPQLDRYARLVGALGPEPVCCGLYFPLLGAWRQWDAPPR